MRNKTSLFKRSLAAVLCLVMVLGLIPILGGGKIALEAEAAPVDTQGYPVSDYITLPITIRDFAADGMLFEYNEVDSSDTTTIGGSGATGYPVYENPTDWAVNNYYSFRLYDYGKITFDATNSGLNWFCAICDASGNVVDVMKAGEEKQTTYDSVMQDGYFSIWVWQGDHENYAAISKVTDKNKSAYAIDFHYDSDAATYKMYIGYRYNANAWGSNYTGISCFDAGTTPFTGYDALWADCLICDASGNVIQSIGAGDDKKTAFNAMTSGQFALFATGNDSVAQGIIRDIAKNNPTEYQATFVTDNYYGSNLLFLGNTSQSMTIHQNDTKGFGLMLTGSNDRIQDLTTTSGPGAYISNGTYGSSDVPEAIDIVLNSGAKQKGYGVTIRKDLVGPELVNGKPAYTKDTVTYLANYMSQIMAEPWQNADGSYNSFFVMGTKLFDEGENYVGPNDPNAVYDLAEILRRHVTGLGDYDTTVAKVQAGGLSYPVQCETWFDAAYYLLHNTWQDSPMESTTSTGIDGYGKYVPEYDSLQLVAKTNADGSVYYVFNSGYDDTAYNPTTGEIFNTQTSNITAAQNSSGDFYTRGIKLPAARFDPLGYSGTSSTGAAQWLGYGPNAGGNTYGDLTGASATQLWADYYDTTNYHLSLEGHAEFVYHHSSDLYFTFTGDDDVYLYINGVRVLDLGAAHSIVKAQININDVAELCELKEGSTYSFDFFYMERHGTAANFGIETNIQLAQSGMITTKQGYQNGVSTGYDGPVDPTKPVAYSFTLKNAGEATLEHLTFTDAKLGVSLSEYNIDLGDKLEAGLEAMYVYVRDENDAIVRFYSATTTPALTEDVLKEELKNGLPKGHSMTLYNFRYKISDPDWSAGSGTFTNVVNTTAIANGKQVNGTADWKVRKAQLVTDPFHVYNWVHKDLEDTEWDPRNVLVTKEELIQPVLDAANKNSDTDLINKTNSSADIVLCNASGNENSALWSEDYANIIKNVTLGEDDSITYNSKTPGMVTIYYKINNIGYPSRVYHFDVITYGVSDNVYVLDYGLNVELNCDQYGFRVNDHLTLPQNIYEANITKTMDVNQQEHRWGEFVESGENLLLDTSVEYQPTDIINGCDSIRVRIRFAEPGYEKATGVFKKHYGVEMDQIVSTAPANVVYYEENHPGITYVNGEGEGGNQWVHYETMDGGESTAGTNQSPDQDMNYGSDPNYAEDKVGVLESDGPVENTLALNLDTSDLNAVQKLGIAALNAYFGLGGGDSNGTVNKLEVKQTADVMYFEFVGTGFEIVSRTTALDYAIINVQVLQDADEDGTYETLMGYKPVITESKGGDLYQIPIISITGMERGKYKVTVKAAGSTDSVNRVLYIDGIRIYGPLANSNLEIKYYNPDEYKAEFVEVKQLIEDGKAIYADLGEFDGAIEFATGYTKVENTFDPGEGPVLMQIDNVGDYLTVGPNNELYMDGNSAINLIAFKLKPKAGWPEAEKTLQVGAHRKADSFGEDMSEAALTYADNYQDLLDRAEQYMTELTVDNANSYIIASGTEMYYTIDVDSLTPDANGNYLVMIASIGSAGGVNSMALTNIKVSGYEIYYVETALQAAAEEGTLDEQPIVYQTFGLLRSIQELLNKEPEIEQVPVNENLYITTAVQSATKVVSGRTVTLTIKANTEAQELVVTDGQGNVVTPLRSSRKVSGDVAIFTFVINVTGSSGQMLNYTARVYDADQLASVNAETFTVTIR